MHPFTSRPKLPLLHSSHSTTGGRYHLVKPETGLATVLSVMALTLFPAARHVQADCTVSSDKLTKTCTGDITGVESFSHNNETSSSNYTFNFSGLTSQTMKGSSGGGPTLQFDSTGKTPGGHTAGISASSLTLNFNTDNAVSGFNIDSTKAPSVQVQATGGNGGSDGENKGSGKKDGGDGEPGGNGGKITLNIDSVNIAASPGKPLVVLSRGGTAGHGRENYSTGGGDGFGGNGGEGGHGRTIDITLDDVTVSNLNSGTATVLEIHTIGGQSGNGGEGKAADYTSRGGVGGAGSPGGNINMNLTGDLTIDGKTATGISLSSQAGGGGNGGEGYNTLSNTGTGGMGGIGGFGGNISLGSTASKALTINASGNGAILIQTLASDGGSGGHGGSSLGEGKGGDGGQGGTGGAITVSLPDTTLDITTTGSAAQGLFARSYGGAGGGGGSGSSTFNKGKGGSASGAGPGGNIDITVQGDITTAERSRGIFAQSNGGGGGDGGSARSIDAIVGSGSKGGIGSTVNVTNSAVITTVGQYS